MLMAIFVVAVLVNYLWEVLQAPLYQGMDRLSVVWWHCGIAALGDGLLVLIIYSIGWATLRRRDWFVRPRMVGYALMLMIGALVGVGIERVAVFTTNRWAYTAAMPLVPKLDVGVVPIIQMVILPPLIFRLTAAWSYLLLPNPRINGGANNEPCHRDRVRRAGNL